MDGKDDRFVGLTTGRCQQKLTANVKSRKLRCFGHTMQGKDKSLEKGTLQGTRQGTLPGNRKSKRPKTRGMDDLTLWAGLMQAR